MNVKPETPSQWTGAIALVLVFCLLLATFAWGIAAQNASQNATKENQAQLKKTMEDEFKAVKAQVAAMAKEIQDQNRDFERRLIIAEQKLLSGNR